MLLHVTYRITHGWSPKTMFQIALIVNLPIPWFIWDTLFRISNVSSTVRSFPAVVIWTRVSALCGYVHAAFAFDGKVTGVLWDSTACLAHAPPGVRSMASLIRPRKILCNHKWFCKPSLSVPPTLPVLWLQGAAKFSRRVRSNGGVDHQWTSNRLVHYLHVW